MSFRSIDTPYDMRNICRVINGIQTGDQRDLFNPENVFLSSHGGGAGNIWASGYDQGEQNAEELAELVGVHRVLAV